MKIEDCKTVPEFFGVEPGGSIWIDGTEYRVMSCCINSVWTSPRQDSQALVGCLTGRLEWSTEPPKPEPNAEEAAILREVAKWFEKWDTLSIDIDGDLKCENDEDLIYPFGTLMENDRQFYPYQALTPILKKCGVIDLRKYREDKLGC
ncbi:MAG: hypothetical protein WCS17_13030 [Prevotella sp.]